MLNSDIYKKNPVTRKLVNEGVASVNDDKTSQALSVLRYELETFVCDGQYQKGMAHILDTFLKNIEHSQQPAVWVSGFYGSGKSHLVKILRALWADTRFEDGVTARGVVTLPEVIRDQFKELSTQAKKYGGLHAASGTLGASSRDKSVRMALLGILFKSVDLPEQYATARFVMWLKSENLYDQVRNEVEANDLDWQEELDNFYVAEGLYAALCKVKPNIFSASSSSSEILSQLYPNESDVSSDDMIKAIKQALTKDGKFPLTLIVLDEIQQYIGEDSNRSIDVQEAVEACSKNIGGKILFIGTGQTAVTGTSNLKRLEGRFTVRVELSDADVDAVIRQVILAKKPDAKGLIEKIMQENLGEISRHLSETTLSHTSEDIQFFAQDYPILPVRRRFWENTLRVLDQTGTDSQLRNQLSMVHKVIQTNISQSLGHVVAADYLYFDAADKLLQSRVLPRKVHEKTMSWLNGSENERLLARACGLVFLVNKLNARNSELGIKATVDTLADLLVEDLTIGSSVLRGKLPDLLNKCELLMRVGDEYRIQTEESSAWNDDFQSQKSNLANETHRIESERDDRIRRKFSELVKRITLTQGNSKVQRDVFPVFDSQLPTDFKEKICIWIRDGWTTDENSVLVEARQAGNQSATVFVFIPKRSADDLRHHLIEFKSASATLDHKGIPNTPEGSEARAAMETIKQSAESKINELLSEAFSGIRVFQGGGNEILGNQLSEILVEATNNALQRLYPQFNVADHSGWGKVFEKAQKGVPDALKMVGDEGEPSNNAVCKAILNFIANGKKGSDIRDNFEKTPYGWSRDAVDGGLQVLIISGLVKAQDEKGQIIPGIELKRSAIGGTFFKIESANISAPQRIQIRKVLQKAKLDVQSGEELLAMPKFLTYVQDLANRAGGDEPCPLQPNLDFLEDVRLSSGNEQLLALYDKRDQITSSIDEWNNLAERITKRLPSWQILKRLVNHAKTLADETLIVDVKTIENQRQLLAEPDLITPLINTFSQLLRDELNRLSSDYKTRHQNGMNRLNADSNWQQLEPEKRNELLKQEHLTLSDEPKIQVATTEEVLATLDSLSLSALKDRVAAIDSRFDAVLTSTAELLEPQAQFVKVPSRTLKSEEDIETWLAEVREQLMTAFELGTIIIR